MGMRKFMINKLSEPVRTFLAQVQDGEVVVVEDEAGRAQYRVAPCGEATPEARRRSWERIQQLQQRIGQAIEAQGGTMAEVEQLILADD